MSLYFVTVLIRYRLAKTETGICNISDQLKTHKDLHLAKVFGLAMLLTVVIQITFLAINVTAGVGYDYNKGVYLFSYTLLYLNGTVLPLSYGLIYMLNVFKRLVCKDKTSIQQIELTERSRMLRRCDVTKNKLCIKNTRQLVEIDRGNKKTFAEHLVYGGSDISLASGSAV